MKIKPGFLVCKNENDDPPFLERRKRRDRHRVWLVSALIAVVVITALTNVGTKLNADFTSVATALR